MTEFDAYLAANPLAKRDAQVIRDALKALQIMRDAGFEQSESYDLAPSFGGRTLTSPKPSLAALRASCVR